MEEIAVTVGGRHRRRVSVGIPIIIAFCIVENSSLVYPAIPATRSTSYYSHRQDDALPYRRISSLFVLMMSQDDNNNNNNEASPSSLGVTTVSQSERSQRKAAQRDRKVRTQTQVNSNKATSQHPDAILKRNRQKMDQLQQQIRRTERVDYYLQQNETMEPPRTETQSIADDFTTSIVETTDDIRPLHSMAVTKLDKMSTTADVVKAIKRAQNYHDMHDIREIATFLLEEVGEYIYFLPSQ